MLSQSQSDLLTQIRDLIQQYFDLSEFRDLCYRLGVSYSHLPGETLPDRMWELVLRIRREGRLADLLTFCAHLRPHVEWPDLAQPVVLDPTPTPFTAPERNPRQIFVSHARQDAAFAHRLADDLRHHSWEIWIAPDSIRPGEGWVSAINRGLAESGIFVLLLTPNAVSSAWVQRETDAAIGLQHQDEIRLIPLEVQAVSAPPLWRAYQWISFQNSYQDGLEQLLRELQPAMMAEVDGLYRQLQTALANKEWATAQTRAAQISVLYPDFRDANDLLAMARQEAIQAEIQAAKAAELYTRLKTALDASAWNNALDLARQIERLAPDYRDVPQLAERARRGRHQSRREAVSKWIGHVPTWGWGGGAMVGVVILYFFFQLAGGQNRNLTATVTRTPPVVGQVTVETLTSTPTEMQTPTATQTSMLLLTPESTPTATTTQSPTPTMTPRMTLSPTPTSHPYLPPFNAQLGDEWIRPQDGMVMVYVPPPDEPGLRSRVVIPTEGYWFDKHPVTNAQYELCVNDGACGPSGLAAISPFNRENYPVVSVSWFDAAAYVVWLNEVLPSQAEWKYALPTEGEWQYAAIRGTRNAYPWGLEISCGFANYEGCVGSTVEVGRYPDAVSWVGALDMAGNVWEWTVSLPQWGEDFRFVRGGSWRSDANAARATFRDRAFSTDSRGSDMGFRVVLRSSAPSS
jgi:formylglycine-generating enzyme required for sulfatase activity